MSIAKEVRLEAYRSMWPKITARQALVVSALENEPMNACEIADKLGFSDLNSVKPRLNELLKAGAIKEVGTRISRRSGKPNTVYQLIKKVAPGGNNTEDGMAKDQNISPLL
jgi:predicted ArsR family transcriptional regulator